MGIDGVHVCPVACHMVLIGDAVAAKYVPRLGDYMASLARVVHLGQGGHLAFVGPFLLTLTKAWDAPQVGIRVSSCHEDG